MDALLDTLERTRARGRRKWAVVALGVTLTVAAGAVVLQRHRHNSRAEQCDAAGAAIEQLWNDTRRAEVRERLLATKVSFAETTATKVMPWIDDHASSWREARVEVCRRATVDESWDAQTIDRSQWCLQERDEDLASFIEDLVAVDSTTMPSVINAAIGLEAALASIEAVREHAKVGDWPPVRATMLYQQSRVLTEMGRYEEAQRVGTSAYVESAGRHPAGRRAGAVAGSQRPGRLPGVADHRAGLPG